MPILESRKCHHGQRLLHLTSYDNKQKPGAIDLDVATL